MGGMGAGGRCTVGVWLRSLSKSVLYAVRSLSFALMTTAERGLSALHHVASSTESAAPSIASASTLFCNPIADRHFSSDALLIVPPPA